jgi:hypothetical protein
MSNIIDEFGQNAGKVWQMLNDKGPLSETKLIRSTFLKEPQLCVAVGWLARENKIDAKTVMKQTNYQLNVWLRQ